MFLYKLSTMPKQLKIAVINDKPNDNYVKIPLQPFYTMLLLIYYKASIGILSNALSIKSETLNILSNTQFSKILSILS